MLTATCGNTSTRAKITKVISPITTSPTRYWIISPLATTHAPATLAKDVRLSVCVKTKKTTQHRHMTLNSDIASYFSMFITDRYRNLTYRRMSEHIPAYQKWSPRSTFYLDTYKAGAACAQWKQGESTAVYFSLYFLHTVHSQIHFSFYKFKTFTHPNDSTAGDCIPQKTPYFTKRLSSKTLFSIFSGGVSPVV